MKKELKKRINNIGIFWEGEQWGGTDTLLSNLVNTETFDEINVVIFTNKKNLGAKRLLKNLINKKVSFVYFNSLIALTSNNIIIKILLNLLKPIFFLISIFQFYFLLRNYKFEVFIGMCGGYGDFRSEMASIFIAKFLGFPVAYAPYYSHPDPSVKRQSGFLVPKYTSNSELGSIFSTPYYFSLSPYKDLTIEPIAISSQRPVIFGQYRQAFYNGELNIEGSFTNAEKRTRSATYSNKNRGHIFIKGNFDHNDFWRYGFDIKRSTDDTYLRRYLLLRSQI